MDAGKGDKKGDQTRGHGQDVGVGTNGAVKRKVPRTNPTRSSARLRNQWLPFEVFNNELLRKKILGFAVFSGGSKEENRKTACSLRLVGKTWNETVIKLLYKRREPLVWLSSSKDGELLLESFWKLFSTSIPINGYLPPFSLEVNYLETEKIKALCDLLTHCGEGLIELDIRWLIMSTRQFPNWSLSRLHKLHCCIFKGTHNSEVGEVTSELGAGEIVSSGFINSVVRDATSIAEFIMTLVFSRPRITEQISDSQLPLSITDLRLFGWMSDGDVEVLTRNPLPKLISLTFFLKYNSLVDGSIYRILDNYRASLKMLYFEDCNTSPGQQILFRFPIMEELEKLIFNSKILELEPGTVSLERIFPKLRIVHLQIQSVAMLRKWTAYSKFISVSILHFALGDFVNVQSLNMETMQSVNFAFPNVRKLVLKVSGMETSGLKYVFREMTQLTELKLSHWGREPEASSDFWDAVLTGVSIETIAESREDPGFWDRFDMNEEEALGSIKNLQELTCLTLGTNQQSNPLSIFISDITFQRTLLKMPNLITIYLYGRLKASAEMTEEWRNAGRVLEYTE